MDGTQRGEKIRQTRQQIQEQNQTNPSPSNRGQTEAAFSQVAVHQDFFKDPEKKEESGQESPSDGRVSGLRVYRHRQVLGRHKYCQGNGKK